MSEDGRSVCGRRKSCVSEPAAERNPQPSPRQSVLVNTDIVVGPEKFSPVESGYLSCLSMAAEITVRREKSIRKKYGEI